MYSHRSIPRDFKREGSSFGRIITRIYTGTLIISSARTAQNTPILLLHISSPQQKCSVYYLFPSNRFFTVASVHSRYLTVDIHFTISLLNQHDIFVGKTDQSFVTCYISYIHAKCGCVNVGQLAAKVS
jgi:hypothetical protein